MTSLETHSWWICAMLALSGMQYVPYFVSMRRGTTIPSISGWLVYSLSLFLIIVSSVTDGSYSAVFVCSIGLLCQLIIVVWGITLRSRISFSVHEKLLVSVSFLSAVLWWQSGDPSTALYLNVGIDVIATILIAVKVYRMPGSENSWTWFIGALSASINLMIFFDYSVRNSLFPVYLLASNLLILLLSLRGPAIGSAAEPAIDPKLRPKPSNQ